jgi:pyruvate/2-oxoglutarate dehydrogenase complex dihydrolipoamide dehydrogenase (E3) component
MKRLTSTRPMTRVGRAVEKGETQGFMKVVVMNAGVPYDVLQRAVPIHPTVSELIPTLLGGLHPVR